MYDFFFFFYRRGIQPPSSYYSPPGLPSRILADVFENNAKKKYVYVVKYLRLISIVKMYNYFVQFRVKFSINPVCNSFILYT